MMVIENIKSKENNYPRIFDEDYHYSCGYYSENCWVDDNRLVLLRYRNLAENKISCGADLVLIDLNDKSEKVLVHEQCDFITRLVYGTTLYYVEDDCVLCSVDVDSLERKRIYKTDDGVIVYPHITADGRYLNWFSGEDEDITIQTCYRIDLQTGEVIKMLEKSFSDPFHLANHMMICPTDPDLIFFSHEGDTRYITNRLWLAPLGEEPYNIAKQRLDKNNNLIDCFGHESWGADGKGLYFVKYACSPEPPCGIGYVDLKTKEPKILYSKYKYWHVCAASNGKYLAADIGPNDADENKMMSGGVCLIDMEKGTERIVAEVKNSVSHPGHPHPQFNPSCSKICFHEIMDNGALGVGIVNI